VYCATGYRSEIAASTLVSAGFADVSDLLGGYEAWVAAGLPVATDGIAAGGGAPQIGAKAASGLIESGALLLDVREIDEWTNEHAPMARLMPMGQVKSRHDELPRDRRIVVVCRSGGRSGAVADALRTAGFDAANLAGGMCAWASAGLPVVHPSDDELVVHKEQPLNCETSIPALIGGVVVPNSRFYVRNHFATPTLDPATWKLSVHGLVDRPLQLCLRDLQAMPSHTFVATLECAGNGRSGFDPPVPGEQWRLGAVSTAEWTGVPLAEVLDRAGVQPEAVEIVMRGADHGHVDGHDDEIVFERSLSVADARESGALLAYAMNGEPLPLQHGFPLRVVVPGWYSVTSVKWLTELEAVSEPLEAFYQTERYYYEWVRDGATVREPVRLQNVRALVTEPGSGDELPAGDVVVRGVAWSGAAAIASVDVRVGDGDWQPARLIGDCQPYRWRWWELLTRIDDAGPTEIRARATDEAGRTQPDEVAWNPLGYGGNAVQVVPVTVR
jgi:DMSO/TMAO reductase YedYZ molybdopterin-dependent catalytic subunit